jgi:hypothetical protein
MTSKKMLLVMPRGAIFLLVLHEALSFTRRRKLEKEIAVIKSALKGHDNKPTTRRASQLKTRLDELEDELKSNP